ncbi:MAG: 7-carboxy-7-deazaguanine synthase QueE, partial [Phycisphaerales bacterium]
DDIIAEIVGHPCSFVEVTGGEPLLQARVHDLMERLCDLGKTVAIETSGACDIGACDPRIIRIMDIKTPGSGEVDRMDWSNLEKLTGRDEVKFVITSRADYEFARELIRERGLTRRVAAVLLSPVFEQPTGLEILGMQGLPMRTLAEWILEDGLDVVLQPQLHKFIWDPQTRGV